MTHHPTATAWLVNWLAATAFLGVFFGSFYLAEQQHAADTQAARVAQQANALEARMLAGASQLCEAELGPGARALFDEDGTLLCRPSLLAARGTP